jgi:hypothetical protein
MPKNYTLSKNAWNAAMTALYVRHIQIERILEGEVDADEVSLWSGVLEEIKAAIKEMEAA